METSDFDELMERYLSGTATEAERQRVDAWLDHLKSGGSKADFVFSKAQEDRVFARVSPKVQEALAYKPSQALRPGVWGWMLRIAASLLTIVCVTYLVWNYFGDVPGLQRAGGKEMKKLILTDGSLVWMERSSKLAYIEQKDGVRFASFSGSGLFEIAKNPSRPFVLRCGNVNMRVLGTSFNVLSTDSVVELKVLTGRVHVNSDDDTVGFDVVANEKVFYHKGIHERSTVSAREISVITKGTEYPMRFKDAPLGEVVRRLGDKFDISVKVVSTNASRCIITADFTDRSLESALQMITDVLDIEYQRREGEIILTGDGCQ